jgi:hypothetical protein
MTTRPADMIGLNVGRERKLLYQKYATHRKISVSELLREELETLDRRIDLWLRVKDGAADSEFC